MKIYCIHDRKANQWYPPFVSYNDDTARRDIAVKYADYPQLLVPDLDIFRCGEFDNGSDSAVNPFRFDGYEFVFSMSEVMDHD